MSVDLSKVQVNIIGEVMSDGQGDWSWVFTIAKQLIDYNIPHNNIKIFYQNVYDVGDTKTNLDKLSNLLDKLQCSDTILQNIYDDVSKLKFLLEDTNNPTDNKILLDKFLTKIYTLSGNMTAQETADIFNIIVAINKGFRDIIQLQSNPTTKISGKKICYYDNTLNTPNTFKIDDINYEVKNSLYSINNISNLNIPSTNTIQINLLNNDISSLSDKDFNDQFEDKINIFFRTQEASEFSEKILNYKPIIIREGGDDTDSALNCNPEFGYVQAQPSGNDQQLQKYLTDNKLPEISKINVAYISLGDSDEFNKLILLIKILSNVIEDLSGNTIGIIGNIYEKIFISNRTTDLNSNNIDMIENKPEKKKIKCNNKTFYIIALPRINLNLNGFNFGYFLEKSNKYCMLSGDMSYMEGLTLGKAVIHVGMSNKYKMIDELKNKIISEIPTSDKSLETSYEEIITNDSLIVLYAKFISDPQYLSKQDTICKKNFFDTLKNKISNKVSIEQYIKLIKDIKLNSINYTHFNTDPDKSFLDENSILAGLEYFMDDSQNIPVLMQIINKHLEPNYLDNKDNYDKFKEFIESIIINYDFLPSKQTNYMQKYLKYKQKYLKLKKYKYNINIKNI
jgi:hypothetical protein